MIQIATGWTDSHLHEFAINHERYGNAGMFDDWDDGPINGKRVRLNQIAAPCSRFIYQYDFGDSWEHEIKKEKAGNPNSFVIIYELCCYFFYWRDAILKLNCAAQEYLILTEQKMP
ncbi:MAG: pRiA4b ORF-3-like protein [Glomeribacter sp. 1016415]|nr:pRiA4b ORF-3-like protein [Glomeribacter sp. 1016415]